MNERFEAQVELDASAEEVYAWHLRPGALERLSPPWEQVRIVSDDGVREGGRTTIEMAVGPVRKRWVALHRNVVDGRGFTDEQIAGPFSTWVHQHAIEPLGPSRAVLKDTVDYTLPLGALGRFLRNSVKKRLERLFAYRHAVLADDLRRHGASPGGGLSIAITGSTGLLGHALVPMLTAGGHEVRRLVRRAAGPDEIAWDPERGTIEADKLATVDAVIHLAGESIGDGRWSDAKKKLIRGSRVRGTTLLAHTLSKLPRGPRTLVSASAIGWYGNRDTPVDEDSPRGEGFLSEVCDAWERAADPARAAGLRVVHPRIGVVLTPAGGALPRLLSAFKLGVGGKLGAGRQGLSWVAIDDVVAGLHAAVMNRALEGPINLCAPHPVDNASFARTLEVLHRPSFLPLPAAAVRFALGEMGETLLLRGAFVNPARLQASGHRFSFPELAGALRHLLGNSRPLPGPRHSERPRERKLGRKHGRRRPRHGRGRRRSSRRSAI